MALVINYLMYTLFWKCLNRHHIINFTPCTVITIILKIDCRMLKNPPQFAENVVLLGTKFEGFFAFIETCLQNLIITIPFLFDVNN